MTIAPGKDYVVTRAIQTTKGDFLQVGTKVTVVGSNDEFADEGIVKLVLDESFGMVRVPLTEELWYNLKEV